MFREFSLPYSSIHASAQVTSAPLSLWVGSSCRPRLRNLPIELSQVVAALLLVLAIWSLGRMPMPSAMKLEDTKVTDEVVTEGSFVPPQQGEWISDCDSTTDRNEACI